MPLADIDSQKMPSPRSIDFHNPGTAAHVAGEIEENYRELTERRDKMVSRWEEESAGHSAALDDINRRIDMVTAALKAWENSQQSVPIADHYPQGMHPR